MKFFCLILLLSSSAALGVSGNMVFKAGTFDKFVSFESKPVDVTGGKFEDGVLSGAFEVNLTGLDTNDKDRDKDMHKELLETHKYPNAKLEMLPTMGNQFKGMLHFHGQSRAVIGSLKIKGKKAVAKFSIKYPEYGIPVKTFLDMVKPDETVDITVKLDL